MALCMIAHLDVDCFFAQVEEVRLSLRGRPLGVQQNMEIAAVNYEARAHGLYNRISVEEGLRKCPDLMLVRGDNGINAMQRYRCAGQAVLRCVMQSLDGGGQDATGGGAAPASAAEWSGRRVEHASFDDFFVLLPDDLATTSAAAAWGGRLKGAVLRATGLRCSIGLARTKLLSVLATKRAKPNGLHCCVGEAEERALLDSARIDRICGAGINGLAGDVRGGLQRYLGKVTTIMRTAYISPLFYDAFQRTPRWQTLELGCTATHSAPPSSWVRLQPAPWPRCCRPRATAAPSAASARQRACPWSAPCGPLSKRPAPARFFNRFSVLNARSAGTSPQPPLSTCAPATGSSRRCCCRAPLKMPPRTGRACRPTSWSNGSCFPGLKRCCALRRVSQT